MKESLDNQSQAVASRSGAHPTFQSIFFSDGTALPIRVPDYQRAYSWEQKQVDLFLADLVKYQALGRRYYFGHFIAEDVGEQGWEIVDGQQRITTFVLFLMVCRLHAPSGPHATAYTLIERFSTVAYDSVALENMGQHLSTFLKEGMRFDGKNPPSDEEIVQGLSLKEPFTRSQRRMALALLRFHQAFLDGELSREHIPAYISVIMEAHCSCHLTNDKSVAVNIFEMHNTRGIPLTTLEVVKAMLMKHVYDHGGKDCAAKVTQIQREFGEIYGMEERMATRSFRGEITMDQLLRLHLRAVDDGTKSTAAHFHEPASNASADDLVKYVSTKLGIKWADGVQYALDLARELKKSVRILSDILPAWDSDEPLVGDVLIQEWNLSYEFFFILCRRLESATDRCDGRVNPDTLGLWEKLLFIRDFHDGYYKLRDRDNFPALFAALGGDDGAVHELLRGYLKNGFRQDHTKGLQSLVRRYLDKNQENILNHAFTWWKDKMVYTIYKYETGNEVNLRSVMKGTPSVEHTLPQEWKWEWTDYADGSENSPERHAFLREIDGCIHGLGNLLLITQAENTKENNEHPAKKQYTRYASAGSYLVHDQTRNEWQSSKNWTHLIRSRGETLYNFMLENLVGSPEADPSSSPDVRRA